MTCSSDSLCVMGCVPVPDANLGEKMCACVILKTNMRLNFEELIDFLKDKEIARFKLPERLELFKDFPVSTFGKVSKKSLVEMLADAHR